MSYMNTADDYQGGGVKDIYWDMRMLAPTQHNHTNIIKYINESVCSPSHPFGACLFKKHILRVEGNPTCLPASFHLVLCVFFK